MVTRTPRKTSTAKKTTTRKTAKTITTPATPVDLRHPLPRRRLFATPWGPSEQAAIRAALAATTARIPVPVRAWNGSTAHLDDGTLLIHNPGPDRVFTAHIACPHGAVHGHPINTHHDLRTARTQTRACTRPHGPQDADTAITHGVGPVPAPKQPVVVQLREGVRLAAETQPLSLTDITTGLTTRTTDHETAKEHPGHA